MKAIQFSAPASEELAAAVSWYEARRKGLGGEFYEAVVRAIEMIQRILRSAHCIPDVSRIAVFA